MELQTSKSGQTDPSGSRIDTVLLAAAGLLLAGVIVVFYYFAVQWALPVRLAVLIAGLAGCVALIYQTELGKLVWAYLVGSRAELRKVVWPTRQEAIRMTWVVMVVVTILSLLLGGFDYLIQLATQWFLGR